MTETMRNIIFKNYPTNPHFPTKAWLNILGAYGEMKPKDYMIHVLDGLERETNYDYEDLEEWYWEFISYRDECESMEEVIYDFVTIALEEDL